MVWYLFFKVIITKKKTFNCNLQATVFVYIKVEFETLVYIKHKINEIGCKKINKNKKFINIRLSKKKLL